MQLSEITLYLREKIEPKLIYSPFLRLIIFSPWFLLGFAAVMITIISVGLYLPKIWRVTPDGFEPVVKISGLDATQNWALKRSARKLESAGKYEPATEAWQRAVAENPADLGALRSSLEVILKLKHLEPPITSAAITRMQWLLRINQTNSADVELVARVCDRMAFYDLAAYLFAPLEKQQNTSGALEAVLIKNLFYQGRLDEFAARLERAGAGAKDPELPFYRLAYQAGWGEAAESEQAFAELEKAVEQAEYSERVGHLLLRAAAQRGALELYARQLDRLGRKNEARADDHALYWTILAAKGQTNQALKLAESSAIKPASGAEGIRVAQSYITLGLMDSARDLLKELVSQYARTPEMWLAYASVLQTKKDWDGMRSAARMIRQDFGVRETLWGFSYYIEGRADLEQKREAAAQEAFDKAVESAYEYPMVGLTVARELARLSFPRRALKIYHAIEPGFADNLGFWDGFYAAAVAAQDAAELLKATEKAYRIRPGDLTRMNNYAASLLVNQVRPEEAIQLTLQLHSKFPQSNAAVINHSCALLLNGRAQEARTLLEQLNVKTLGSNESSQYFLTLFETYHMLKMWDQARKARELIVEAALFPIQRERLKEKEKDLPKTLAGAF